VVVRARADVGESPVWDDRAGKLMWVDMTTGDFFAFDPSSGLNTELGSFDFLGAAILGRDGRYVLARRDGLYSLYDTPQCLVAIDESDDTRFLNDAVCDSRGRMFLASATDQEIPGSGCVYRVDPNLSLHVVISGTTLANGMGFSPDETVFYAVDSRRLRVTVFDYDRDTGTLSHERVFVETPEAAGLPDGLTVDRDGGVWVAYWGGSTLRYYRPDGTLERVVNFPVSQISSCGFGGACLTDLYVTSARAGLASSTLADEPLAGSLFRVSVEVPGLRVERFGG
jgi:sugar lactone lactonase YvrE